MYQTILEKFSTFAALVMTDGSTIMMVEGVNILHFSAIILILVFLAARLAKKIDGGILKLFRRGNALTNNGTAVRTFERKHLKVLKKCPNCAEDLPLSTLICDACEYNFLSGMVGCRNRMLPSPEPLGHEVLEHASAYRA